MRTRYSYFRDLLKEMQDSPNAVLRNTGSALLTDDIEVVVLHEDCEYTENTCSAMADIDTIYIQPRWYYLDKSEKTAPKTLNLDKYTFTDKEYFHALLAHETNHVLNFRGQFEFDDYCQALQQDIFLDKQERLDKRKFLTTLEYHGYSVGQGSVFGFEKEDVKSVIKKYYDLSLSDSEFDDACHLNWNSDNSF